MVYSEYYNHKHREGFPCAEGERAAGGGAEEAAILPPVQLTSFSALE